MELGDEPQEEPNTRDTPHLTDSDHTVSDDSSGTEADSDDWEWTSTNSEPRGRAGRPSELVRRILEERQQLAEERESGFDEGREDVGARAQERDRMTERALVLRQQSESIEAFRGLVMAELGPGGDSISHEAAVDQEIQLAAVRQEAETARLERELRADQERTAVLADRLASLTGAGPRLTPAQRGSIRLRVPDRPGLGPPRLVGDDSETEEDEDLAALLGAGPGLGPARWASPSGSLPRLRPINRSHDQPSGPAQRRQWSGALPELMFDQVARSSLRADPTPIVSRFIAGTGDFEGLTDNFEDEDEIPAVEETNNNPDRITNMNELGENIDFPEATASLAALRLISEDKEKIQAEKTLLEEDLAKKERELEEKYKKDLKELQAISKLEIEVKEKRLTELREKGEEERMKLKESLGFDGSLIPECPVCLDRMAAPRQIYNCSEGHLVCGDCRPRVRRCAVCRGRYTGRATAMEQVVRRIMNIE